MKFLLLASTLLLACSVITADPVPAAGAKPLNTSNILESINHDLDEIKRTLSQQLTSRNQLNSAPAAGAEAKASEKITFSEGQYIKTSAENGKPGDVGFTVCSKPTEDDSIYKYSIKYLNASLGTLDFAKHTGKPILIVNVATFCESTIEYPLLNGLKDKFGDKLEIVAFPSAQFANQEPTDNPTEIFNAIKYVRPGNGFVPKFPLTIRIDVNGEERHPIYSFLKRSCPSTRTRLNSDRSLLYAAKNARDIRWNFEKFLIHPVTGTPWKRYDQKYTSDRIADDIQLLLDEGKKL